MSVLSPYCVLILLHCVSLCSVVFLYSLSATFCLPVLTFAPFSVWGFVPPLLFEALSSFCWGFVLMLYQGFVLVFLYWGFVLIFYIVFWGLILIFFTEALSSYFILRLCRHILYWGFVLIVLYWGYVPQFEALVLIVVGPCYFVSTTSLVCLQWYVCGSVCLYFCLEPDANIVWF